ncbi:Uncharacterised protein [Bordetella pertussis]|nr:Uncharacterised protein [Bordetella pertussis]
MIHRPAARLSQPEMAVARPAPTAPSAGRPNLP